jgi:hypothetical protein
VSLKPYTFLASGNQRVNVGDDEVTFRPILADKSLRRQHWAKTEILAVSVGPSGAKRRRCEVSLTRADGTVRRFREVMGDAAEVATAFDLRGYKVRS